MDYKRIALLLEDQLKLAAQREEELLKVIGDQNEQLNILTAEVKSLNSSILSLEKALLEKNASATNLFLPVLSSISITSTIMPVKAQFMPEVCQLSPC
ncbi:hypothetical protein [Parabacteroides merdae]|uniref:hypothetical protein n=1 Tax=Parabacteroides merdae TaxID=46503 RepID=UPI0034A4FB93